MAHRNWRKSDHWDWAKENAAKLDGVLPNTTQEAALATCWFELRGLNSRGNTRGKGILTHMQTFGERPVGVPKVGCQIHHHWIELDSHESADAILEVFDLTTADIYEHFGQPAEGETVKLDLMDVVMACSK